MSFKLFIYYCALCGGWFGLVGWFLGRWLIPAQSDGGVDFLRTIFRGLTLGMMVALGLGIVDALWNLSSWKMGSIVLRAFFVSLVGCLGGLVGSALGQALFDWTNWGWVLLVGWLVTGLFIGASIGGCEILSRLIASQKLAGAGRKFWHGLLGGALGGLFGGLLYMGLGFLLSRLLGRPQEEILSSSAWGFVALGSSIGLFIGLAQLFFKEAWIRVEQGFRPGREILLNREITLIGRSEACDLGLFGDPGIDKIHARILLQNQSYYLEDAAATAGTFLNEEKIARPTLLQNGDILQVGQSILRFGERQKRR